MKNLVLSFVALFVVATAHAQSATPAAEAQDGVQMMDESTPDELQNILGLVPGMNGEMVPEKTTGLRSNVVVDIRVSLASQRLTVRYPGGGYTTLISSGREGHATKTGCFMHPHLELMHYSSKYENAPMPHSMFYYGGFAVHGTYDEAHLGRPASHGCVRVSLNDAADLYSIVQQFGAQNTRICVQ
jgi:lipoprotein-anchoring transpeptidase ErfK/SrfK